MSDIIEIQLPLFKTEYAENIYWVYGIVLDDKLSFNAKEFIVDLEKNSIGTRPFFWPMHQQPILNKLGFVAKENYPVAENLSLRGLYLPSGLGLLDKEIRYIVNILREFIVCE